MRRIRVALLAAAVVSLFCLANRAAWRGYFQHDDFAHLSWTIYTPLASLAGGLVSPQFYPTLVRPVGHLWYGIMGRTAGLHFIWYILFMNAVHLLGVGLVWLWLRRLGTRPFAAGAGALFFAFHAALFDLYWHTAYVFDLLCGVFCLLSLLSWASRRYVLSFICFWLAYKSKEPAVMLPAVLACYELWFGERRWKTLAPFFLVSAWFGVQGVLRNPASEHEYAFRFAPAAVFKTLAYYTGQLALVPLAVLGVPAVVRERRVYLGTATFLLLLAPMLILPGRARGVYLYEGMIGAALVFAAVAEKLRPWMVALFFLFWLPFNYAQVRKLRGDALDEARDNRAYTAALVEDARRHPGTHRFLFETMPDHLPPWGISSALKVVYAREPELRWVPELKQPWTWPDAALLSWDPVARRLYILRPGEPVPYVRMDGQSPAWVLGEGWYGPSAGLRWMRAKAAATLQRPAGSRRFEFEAQAGAGQPDGTVVEVALDGQTLGAVVCPRVGRGHTVWNLEPAAAGPAVVELRVAPRYLARGQDGELGAAVIAFGFR